jgi:hypothetical protein
MQPIGGEAQPIFERNLRLKIEHRFSLLYTEGSVPRIKLHTSPSEWGFNAGYFGA